MVKNKNAYILQPVVDCAHDVVESVAQTPQTLLPCEHFLFGCSILQSTDPPFQIGYTPLRGHFCTRLNLVQFLVAMSWLSPHPKRCQPPLGQHTACTDSSILDDHFITAFRWDFCNCGNDLSILLRDIRSSIVTNSIAPHSALTSTYPPPSLSVGTSILLNLKKVLKLNRKSSEGATFSSSRVSHKAKAFSESFARM